MLGSECMRASTWQKSDPEKFRLNLERAFELIDMMIDDPQWHSRRQALLGLREYIGGYYIGTAKGDIATLYAFL